MLGTTRCTNGLVFRVWAPQAKQVSVIGAFNGWSGAAVIYELHDDTFNDDDPFRPGKFITVTARLEHLKRLGVNAI
jgi:1,4-alpha-glucan branching enzyme